MKTAIQLIKEGKSNFLQTLVAFKDTDAQKMKNASVENIDAFNKKVDDAEKYLYNNIAKHFMSKKQCVSEKQESYVEKCALIVFERAIRDLVYSTGKVKSIAVELYRNIQTPQDIINFSK